MSHVDGRVERPAMDQPPATKPGICAIVGAVIPREIEVRVVDALRGLQHILVPAIRPEAGPHAVGNLGPGRSVVVLVVGGPKAEVDRGPRAWQVQHVDRRVHRVHHAAVVRGNCDRASPVRVIQARLEFAEPGEHAPPVVDVVIHALGDVPVMQPPGVSLLEVVQA